MHQKVGLFDKLKAQSFFREEMGKYENVSTERKQSLQKSKRMFRSELDIYYEGCTKIRLLLQQGYTITPSVAHVCLCDKLSLA